MYIAAHPTIGLEVQLLYYEDMGLEIELGDSSCTRRDTGLVEVQLLYYGGMGLEYKTRSTDALYLY